MHQGGCRKYLVGIDLGGTKIAVAVVDAVGQVLQRVQEWTRGEEGPERVLARINCLLDAALAKAGVSAEQVAGIGIGAPGIVDWKEGIVHNLTNLPGWRNVNLKERFEQRYSLPVAVDNDANAAALGEYLFGSGRGVRHMLYLTISTGIGGGIIQDGRLVHGAWGVAGEVGHMVLDPQGELCNCGNCGCWETISSGRAIARQVLRRIARGEQSMVTELAGGGEIKAEHVFQARQLGDELAAAVIRRALLYLGVGVANLVNVLNPERVVIGGGVANVGEVLFEPVRRQVRELGFGPAARAEIVPAALGKDAGVVGAAALVWNMLQ